MLFLRVIAWYGAEKISLKKVVSIFTSGGTMSLVGTRPILQDELQKYELHHRARIAIKPGITGMWQVSGRSDITDFEEVVRLDTEYISKACFVLAGIDEKSLLQAVDTAVQMNQDGDYGIPVPDYVEENVSSKVVKLIQSYTGVVNKMVWRKQ